MEDVVLAGGSGHFAVLFSDNGNMLILAVVPPAVVKEVVVKVTMK